MDDLKKDHAASVRKKELLDPETATIEEFETATRDIYLQHKGQARPKVKFTEVDPSNDRNGNDKITISATEKSGNQFAIMCYAFIPQRPMEQILTLPAPGEDLVEYTTTRSILAAAINSFAEKQRQEPTKGESISRRGV